MEVNNYPLVQAVDFAPDWQKFNYIDGTLWDRMTLQNHERRNKIL